jgi:anti-anti-sigma factor
MIDATVTHEDGVTRVRFAGDMTGLDVTKAAEVLAEVTDAADVRVIVDLSETNVIDSTGLGELVSCVTKARMRQGEVILLSPTPFVAGVLSTTRLDHFFEIFDSLDDAKARLTSA